MKNSIEIKFSLFQIMRVINKEIVEKIYTFDHAIQDCQNAFAVLASKSFSAPVRSSLKTKNEEFLLMPSAIEYENHTDLVLKVLSVVPENPKRRLPLIPGKVFVYEEETGTLKALIDGFIITFKRTGAVAGTSAKILHPAPVKNVVIFGCGAQGTAGLDSILYVHPEVEHITCFDYFKEAAIRYQKAHEERKDGRTYVVGENVEEAIRNADVIHCATTSQQPLFKGEWVKDGAHISAIGAYKLDMREIPNDLWARPNARVFIDDFDAIHEEAGDLMDGIRSNCIKEEDIHYFGDVILKKVDGRQNDKQITILKVVGHSVQDNIAATTIVKLAEEQNEGVIVDI